MLTSALTAGWLALATTTTGYEVSLRALTRVRTATVLEAPAATVAGDLQLEPAFRLRLLEQDMEGWLTYSPRLTLRQARGHLREELLHTAHLHGEWRPRRGLSLFADQHAAFGTVDLLTQQLDPTAVGEGNEDLPDDLPLEPVPPGPVGFASSRTTLSAETTLLHPRLRLRSSLEYTVGGGRDREAREQLPLQYGPRLRLDAGYNLTRLDALTTTLTATDLRFSTGAHSTVVMLEEVWAHDFNRATQMELGGGLGFTRVRATPDTPAQYGLLPGALASVRHRLVSRQTPVEARLTAQLSPFVDRLSADVYPRLELRLLVLWKASTHLWLHGQGAVGRALGGVGAGDALGLALVGARWNLARGVDLEADVRHYQQRPRGEQRLGRLEWAGTLSLSVSRAGMF